MKKQDHLRLEEYELSTNIERALALAKLGFSVFPADPSTKMPVYAEGEFEHGHLGSSSDPEQLATWFTVDFPKAEVGVNAGASEIVALDLDVRQDTNGFESVGFLSIPETYSYFSKSGSGKHFIYDLANSSDIPPSNKYRGMSGVDRKSGSSYIIWWGDVPESRDAFAAPPDWLLDVAEITNTKSGFSGDVEEWFETIPEGDPTPTVRKIIESLPTKNFGHNEVISITYRLVRLAAEGHTGVRWAFDQIYAKWVKPPFDGPEHRRELSDAIYGAIRKAGDEDERVRNLPPYEDCLPLVGGRVIDILLSSDTDSRMVFKAITACVAEHISVPEIASLVWNAPSTMLTARDWGLDYLYRKIEEARDKAVDEPIITGPELDEDETSTPTEVTLLTSAERQLIAHESSFVKRYSAHAATRVPKQNLPYDIMNGWTILSCWSSTLGFIPRKNGKEGLNIFGMILGDTTSGKSASRKLLMAVLKELFIGDPGFNIGGNPSPSALGKKLLERDKKVSFFNKDEAHGAMKTWIAADWQSGLLEALADLYEGRVDAQLRTSDWAASGKSAETHFVMHLQATPKAMIELLTKDLFLSGFLARFIWAIGWPREVTYDSMAEDDADGDEVRLGYDPYSRQLACELALMRRQVQVSTNSSFVPVRIDSEASKRIQEAKWALNEMFKNDANFDILQPSLVRMGVMIRKAASMLALSEGRASITLRDTLMALEAVETWTTDLASVAKQIVSSDWQRATDEVEEFIASRPNGEEKRERVLRRFKHIKGMDLESYLSSLINQGRIREFSGANKGKMLGINHDRD